MHLNKFHCYKKEKINTIYNKLENISEKSKGLFNSFQKPSDLNHIKRYLFIEHISKLDKKSLENIKEDIIQSADTLDKTNKIYVYEYLQKSLVNQNNEEDKEKILLNNLKNIGNKKIKTKQNTLIKQI